MNTSTQQNAPSSEPADPLASTITDPEPGSTVRSDRPGLGPETRQLLDELGECLRERDDRTSIGPGSEPRGDDSLSLAWLLPSSAVGARGPWRFRLERELGRGGFGVVHLAHDLELNRKVALKIPRPDLFSGAVSRRLLLEEARTAADLRHTHLLPIFDVIEHEASIAIVSEYCDGGSLAHWMIARDGQGVCSPRLAARIVAALADGLQHAHERKLLHLDLKPRNILLQRTAPGPDGLDFVPMIGDFGLARSQESGLRPLSDGPIGTYAYMAPEQTGGRGAEIGPATDIYGLGTILYELLTGGPPLRGATRDDTIELIRATEPTPPSQLRRDLPLDLDTIVLKCLRKEPSERYATAEELATDLRRFLEARSRRHLVASVALILVGVLVLGVLIERMAGSPSRAADQAVARLVAAPTDVVRRQALEEEEKAGRRRLETRLEPRAGPAEPNPRHRANAALAWLALDAHQVQAVVLALIDAPPDVAREGGQALRDHFPEPVRTAVAAQLLPWADTAGTALQQLAAASVLAWLDAQDPGQKARGRPLAELLAGLDPRTAAAWALALKPSAASIVAHLESIYRDPTHPSEGTSAAYALATLRDDQPDALVDLVIAGSPFQIAPLAAALGAHRDQAVQLLKDQLHTPVEFGSLSERECGSRQRANAADALLRLGAAAEVWPFLGSIDDPDLRTMLLHRLATIGTAPARLMEELHQPQTTGRTRQALILALGEYRPDAFAPGERDRIAEKLLLAYREDQDPGVHTAIAWLLRMRWGRSDDVARANAELTAPGPAPGFGWYHDPEGFTMIVIPAGATFVMRLADSPDDGAEKTARQVTIPHAFAIAATSVTNAQYRRRAPFPRAVPDDACPITTVNYADAARYCLRISDEHGIDENQWCFPAEALNPEVHPVPHPDYTQRTGYRLPTEEEYEYASRALTRTICHFGASGSWAAAFEWFVDNAEGRLHPVGELKPNPFGLHDVLGTALEWCTVPPHRAWDERQILKATSINSVAGFLRSDKSITAAPNGANPSVSRFRIARTLRDAGSCGPDAAAKGSLLPP